MKTKTCPKCEHILETMDTFRFCSTCGFCDYEYKGLQVMAENTVQTNGSSSFAHLRKLHPIQDWEKCIKCYLCAAKCPNQALRWINGRLSIREALCNNCRKCVSLCPVEAIR